LGYCEFKNKKVNINKQVNKQSGFYTGCPSKGSIKNLNIRGLYRQGAIKNNYRNKID